MTVKELISILEKCDKDIQVVGVVPTDDFNIIKSVKSVEQVTPYSCHDEPNYPDVVEITIR